MAGSSRTSSYLRAWNIALRTAHIGAAGALFGGHVFGIEAERLLPWLGLTILTGAMLAAVEAYPSWRWLYEARAVMILTKGLLLLLVPWLWSCRIPMLLAIIVIGSVGSHMPKRLRHYSLAERRFVDDESRPRDANGPNPGAETPQRPGPFRSPDKPE